MSRYRGRFAPSPTGDLHAGSLVAALGSWLLARRARGAWIVRIEDLDAPREVPGAADRQLDALSVLGLVADEPVVHQSTRHLLYRDALGRLLDSGHAFDCYCSRSDLAATGGVHRTCVRGPSAGRRPAVRFRIPDGTHVDFVDGVYGHVAQRVDREVGDFVLHRADGIWAYQLAVVVDDADQGITDVVRGADLLDSTPRQILLQQALGLATPSYSHLPLVLDRSGRKLSKSEGAGGLDPRHPLPALRRAWAALGQPADPLPAARSAAEWLEAACERFDPARIPHDADGDTAAAHDA